MPFVCLISRLEKDANEKHGNYPGQQGDGDQYRVKQNHNPSQERVLLDGIGQWLKKIRADRGRLIFCLDEIARMPLKGARANLSLRANLICPATCRSPTSIKGDGFICR
jgi:hypothetical protein